jgi:hypothetical protein
MGANANRENTIVGCNRGTRKESRLMNAEQPCQRYSGVTRHAGKWLAKFRHNGKDLNLGHYEDPERAAWAADFARYLCFGLNPAKWHPRVGRPNPPPCAGDDSPRRRIIRKLLGHANLPASLLVERLAEYDAVVGQNADGCAYG